MDGKKKSTKKKALKVSVPGIHHPVGVAIYTQAQLARKLGDRNVMAAYVHEDALIMLSSDVAAHPKRHAFYHEMAHHIIDTLSSTANDETRADLLGSLLLRLIDESREIEAKLGIVKE